MRLEIESIHGILAAGRSNRTTLQVDCEMTGKQMCDAIRVFCEHLSDDERISIIAEMEGP